MILYCVGSILLTWTMHLFLYWYTVLAKSNFFNYVDHCRSIDHFFPYMRYEVPNVVKMSVLGLLGCNAMRTRMYILIIRKNILPPHSEDGSSMFFQNIGIYLQVHTALQPWRQTMTLFFSQQIDIPSSVMLLSSSSHEEIGWASLTAFSNSWLGALEYGVTIRRLMAGMNSQ
jgi:hypothetical protein